MVCLELLPLMRTTRLPAVDRTDVLADLNGLVRFAERRNLVSVRVPSHFKWPLTYSSKVEGTGIFETILSTLQHLPFDTNSAITVLTGHITTDRHLYVKTLRTGLLNCLNTRSRGLNVRHRASCI